ncbi:hypothetical protein cgp_4013 [Corynebacterium glutamicum MB001]|nr:hypothetical protein cgp_4013 [Corynebacterium glutamicum MB001]QYO72962.1 hypothetical protein cgisf_4013 [Corynebacterium glutamicum]
MSSNKPLSPLSLMPPQKSCCHRSRTLAVAMRSAPDLEQRSQFRPAKPTMCTGAGNLVEHGNGHIRQGHNPVPRRGARNSS